MNPSSQSDGDGVDGVAAVAEAIPLRLVGLAAAGEVGRSGAHRCPTWLVELDEKLPPPPAVALAVADEAGGLPGAVADAHIDAGDWRRARPRHTADEEITGGDLLIICRFGDD